MTKRRMEKQENWKNRMHISFDAVSVNEAFARIVVAAFVAPLNPTLEEVADIKTAVSEAVTNAIIHGYGMENKKNENILCNEHYDDNAHFKIPQVEIDCLLDGDVLQVEVIDAGSGIENIEQAMEPLFTTRPDMDRSGMGFAFMEAFMDDLEVISAPGCGTTIRMKKKMGITAWFRYED